MEKVFKKEFPNKIIYKINGSTNLKKRQEVLDKMLDNDNVILVASYGCCGTGLTLKNPNKTGFMGWSIDPYEEEYPEEKIIVDKDFKGKNIIKVFDIKLKRENCD